MLRDGNQIKLHTSDVDRLELLTGARPAGIATVADWNRFVGRHLSGYDGKTPQSKLLRMLLADELLRPLIE